MVHKVKFDNEKNTLDGEGKTVKDPYWVDALAQGLQVLHVFDNERCALTLSEIASKLGWNRTKPYRFLHTLEKLGYLARDDAGRGFRLTSLSMQLGFSYLNSIPLVELAQPLLDKLRTKVGASTNLAILERDETVFIAQARTKLPTTINLHVGSRLSAYATSSGRILLAHLPEHQVIEMLEAQPLTAWTSKSVTDPAQFLQILRTARKQGYVLNDGEFQEGIRSVAAPVFDARGVVIAGVNTAATSFVFSDEKLDQIREALRETADELSRAMGYRPDPQAHPSDRRKFGRAGQRP